MKPVLVRVSLVLAVVVGLFGCERLRDVKRCRQVAQRVNASLDTIAELAPDGGTATPAYDKVSHEYDAIAAGLDGFDGGTPELVRAVGEYAALARTSARQAAALGAALKEENKGSATLASHELERLSRHEKTLVARIDEECRPK